jgi:drug/metabolite transporter (DMT)-like permease
MGLFLLLGGNGLVSWAEQRVVSGVAALLIGGTPMMIVLVDWVRPGGGRPAWRTLVGIAIGFLGIAFLISPAEFLGAGEGVDLIGAGAVVFASLFWAIGSIYGRERSDQLPGSPLLSTSMEMLAGGAGLIVIGTLTGEWGRVDLSAVKPEALIGLGYLIFFGSLVAYSAYTWLLRVAPISMVSTYAYVNPLVAVLLGAAFANEPLTLRVLGAAVFILGAVALINTARPQVKPAPAQTMETRPGRGAAPGKGIVQPARRR